MPVEINEEVTTKSSSPVSDRISQTASTTQTPTDEEQRDAESDRGNAWVWYIVGVIDLLLALGLVLHLSGARAVGFANFIYIVATPFAAPFRGIFQNPKVEGSYFDMASFVAIIVYVLLGWIIARLIDLSTRPSTSNKI